MLSDIDINHFAAQTGRRITCSFTANIAVNEGRRFVRKVASALDVERVLNVRG